MEADLVIKNGWVVTSEDTFRGGVAIFGGSKVVGRSAVPIAAAATCLVQRVRVASLHRPLAMEVCG